MWANLLHSHSILEDAVLKLIGTIGAFIGSTAGWWIGAQMGGMMTAFMVSMVGTGAGIYWGRKLAQHYLE